MPAELLSGLPLLAAEPAAVFRNTVEIGLGSALFVAALVALTYTTRSGIIARSATKEAIRQPVFSLLLVLSLALLVLNTVMPFFSLGEDIKMFKECGLATILISGLLMAIWTSSASIADEIEGKTAMTLLSKPINRRQFITGKYLGILNAVLLMLIPLVIVFLALIIFKAYSYDPRESTRDDVTIEMAVQEMLLILPGVVLIYLEIAVLSAVSVAISTRVPMVVNMVTCLAIFVVGHLTEVLVAAGVVKNELVLFVARVSAIVLPALNVFDIQAAIATGEVVPSLYLGYTTLYSIAYCVMAILLAFILFEDRDLA
jgi:ABC-type transport system involved in multi-copper enzyme maturation permease subunit